MINVEKKIVEIIRKNSNTGQYLKSRNGNYQQDFENSKWYLSGGFTIIWRYGFSNSVVLYFDLSGLSLVLLDILVYYNGLMYK